MRAAFKKILMHIKKALFLYKKTVLFILTNTYLYGKIVVNKPITEGF